MMDVKINDIIETLVGGPYKVTNVEDNVVTFKMRNGIGITIEEYVTTIIREIVDTCEYSGLPSVKSYEK